MSVSHQTYITETNHETNKLYSTVTCNPNTSVNTVVYIMNVFLAGP